MKLVFSRQYFDKYLNIKFHENPSSGSRVVPYGRTDSRKLMDAFRNFANASKNVTDIASLFTVNVVGMMDMGKQAHVRKSEGKTLFGKS